MKIANVDLKELVKKVKTPLFVYNENAIEERVNEFLTSFKSNVFDTKVIYASKAFACTEIFKLFSDKGLGLDLVSGGEIYTALKASVNKSMCYFHGNNKTIDEINLALDNDINHFVIDNYTEAVTLEKIAKDKKKRISCLLRVNSGVEAHTHKYIVTSHIDSKFGVLIKSTDFNNILDILDKSEYLVFDGFHSHIGSQIFDTKAFNIALEKMLELGAEYKASVIDIGGGFGVRYTAEDAPLPIPEMMRSLIDHAEETVKKLGYDLKTLMIEPGRSLVAEAGSTIYTIGNIKNTPNKTYYFIDGGMGDNIRPALYEALYDCDIIGKENDKKEVSATIAGKFCESGDIIIQKTLLPKASIGDLLITYVTGAYGYSMSNNYNKFNRPPVVFLRDGKARVVVERESLEDLVKYDCNKEINL